MTAAYLTVLIGMPVYAIRHGEWIEGKPGTVRIEIKMRSGLDFATDVIDIWFSYIVYSTLSTRVLRITNQEDSPVLKTMEWIFRSMIFCDWRINAL